MKIMTRAIKLSCAALIVGSLWVNIANAQSFSPVAIVNDEVITGYDVEQRALLLQAAGDNRDLATLRTEALDKLIEDRLRIQAAKEAGVVLTQEDIKVGFDRLSRQNGREPDTMRQFFQGRGVAPASLDAQVEAEVAWLSLVRRRYMPRIRITNSEIAQKAAEISGASEEIEYLLTEIRLPIGIESEAVALANARNILMQLVGQGGFGALARQHSTGPTAAQGGDLGWVASSGLSPAAQSVVSQMSADRASAPFVDGGEVVIYGLRGIREKGARQPIRYTLAQIVVGLAGNASQAQADIALQQAYDAKAQIIDCGSVDAIKQNYLPISGQVGNLTFSEMPAPVREAVRPLQVGGISEPIRSNDGFHVIVLCDKTAPAMTRDPVEAARDELTANQLERYARSLLKELRREAVIERR